MRQHKSCCLEYLWRKIDNINAFQFVFGKVICNSFFISVRFTTSYVRFFRGGKFFKTFSRFMLLMNLAYFLNLHFLQQNWCNFFMFASHLWAGWRENWLLSYLLHPRELSPDNSHPLSLIQLKKDDLPNIFVPNLCRRFSFAMFWGHKNVRVDYN